MECKYFSWSVGNILKATKIYATILLERYLTPMLCNNTGRNKGSKIQQPLKFVCLQQHLLGVNRIIQWNHLIETNVNVTSFIKTTTKGFFKGKFYNKTLIKTNIIRIILSVPFFVIQKFPLLHYLNKILQKATNFFFNTLFL